jgi:hypothetical protein
MKVTRVAGVVILCLLVLRSVAQKDTSDDLDLQKMLMPIDSTNIFQEDDQYVWCNSAVKGADGKYHLFYARWSHGKRVLDDDSLNYIFDGFSGWLKYSEIAHAVSENLTGPYRFRNVVYKGDRDPSHWDRYSIHNPQIREFEGKYYLYYIANSFDPDFKLKGANKERLHWLKYNCTQKIGVLVADNLNDLATGKFRRSAVPLMEADNKQTFEVANNPSVTRGPDGKFYMIFKSRKPNVGHMTMWMARSDYPDRSFKIWGEVFTSADLACEDPCLWYDKIRKRFYAVVKYYSNAKKLAPQFGALALVTSVDGMHWEGAKNSLVSLRQLKFKNGEVMELDRLERPFVVTDADGQPLALLAAASQFSPKGAGIPEKGRNSFDVAIPLAR